MKNKGDLEQSVRVQRRGMQKTITIRALQTELLRKPSDGAMLLLEFGKYNRADVDKVRIHSYKNLGLPYLGGGRSFRSVGKTLRVYKGCFWGCSEKRCKGTTKI